MVCNVTKSLNLSESFTFYKEEANYSWCKDFASGCVGFYFHALQWLELHSGKNYRLYVSKIWRSFFFFYSHLLIFYRPLIPENKTLQCQIPFDLETSLIIKKKHYLYLELNHVPRDFQLIISLKYIKWCSKKIKEKLMLIISWRIESTLKSRLSSIG